MISASCRSITPLVPNVRTVRYRSSREGAESLAFWAVILLLISGGVLMTFWFLNELFLLINLANTFKYHPSVNCCGILDGFYINPARGTWTLTVANDPSLTLTPT